MRAIRLYIEDFRQFKDCEIIIGKKLTAVAGNNGTGKSTILGLLANSSQLPRKKTYIGKPFRGEFSELFSGSPGQDPTGRRIRLDYIEHEQEKTIEFRTAWQDEGTRFRVIPIKRKLSDGRTTEAKLTSPIIYLGLSRLYPFGEADEGSLRRHKQRWDNDDDRDWFIKTYKEILSLRSTAIESVSSFDIAHSRKRGTGVKTGDYGPAANSAGQDNLGQILMAVLSFRKLAREMGESWDGGMLLIDEVDATLHPAAQRRLINLLLKEAGEHRFQVIFTTHSTVVLEHIVDKTGHVNDDPNDVEIAYLTDASRSLKVKRNPSWHIIATDLFVRGPGMPAPKVGVFSEDGEARWIMQEIIKVLIPTIIPHIEFIDASFGKDQLIQLYEHDFLYMQERIVVFDGDVKDEDIEKIPKQYRDMGRNIVILPGSVRPENLIWDFLCSAEESNPVWGNLERYGYTHRSIMENGPDTDAFSQYSPERNRYKEWLKACMADFNRTGVVKCWVEANLEVAWDFVKSFLEAYNRVARKTSADPVAMPDRPDSA